MASSKSYNIAFKLGAKLNKNYSNSFKQAESIANKTAASLMKTAAKVGGAVFSAKAIKDSIKVAMDVESSTAGIVKVVDTLKDANGELTQGYYDIKNGLMDLTRQIPLTYTELAEITAAAGQAGIAEEELLDFTESAAKMGVAFDISAEQAGSWMANWRTAFGINQEEVIKLADQINYLGNNSTQSAAEIGEVVSRVGNIGLAAGVSSEDVAALAASLAGVAPEKAATGLSNFFQTLAKGESITNSQHEAFARLGIDSTQLSKKMQSDARGTMLEVLNAISMLDQDLQVGMITDLFGSGTANVDAISQLVANTDNLEKNFTLVADVELYGGSMEGEFESMAATTANKMVLIQNAVTELKAKIGEQLLPVTNKVGDLIQKNLYWVIDKLPVVFERISEISSSISSILTPRIEGIKNTLLEVIPAVMKLKDDFINVLIWIKETGINTFTNISNVVSDNQSVFSKLIDVATDLKDILYRAFEFAQPVIEWLFTNGLPIVIDLMLGLVDKATDVFNFFNNNWTLIGPIVYGIATAIGAVKFVKLISRVKKATVAFAALTKAKLIDKAETLYLMALYAKDAIVKAASTAATIAQTVATTAWNVVAGIATAVTTALGAAFAFLTSPIGLVILAIGAIIAIVVLLIKNWETVKEVASSVWEHIATVFNNIYESVSASIQNIIDYVSENFPVIGNVINTVIEGIRGCIEGVKQLFSGIIDFIAGVFTADWERAWQGVQDIFGGIFNGLVSLAKAPLNAIISLVNSAIGGINNIGIDVPDWVPGAGGKSFSPNIPQIPMLAKGSEYSPHAFIAGEEGPELITNASGKKVFTALETGNIFNNLNSVNNIVPFPESKVVENINTSNYSNIYNSKIQEMGISPIFVEPDENKKLEIKYPNESKSFNNSLSPISIEYSPQITVNGADSNNNDLLNQIKQLIDDENINIIQLINDTIDQRERRRERLSNV